MGKRERRAWPRQPGYVGVLVLDPEDALEEPFAGWLLNYSAGGVCLSFRGTTLQNGAVLRLQPVVSASATSWIDVCVRNRRQTPTQTLLGCEFVRGAWEWLLTSA
jgi:hypothetical protein